MYSLPQNNFDYLTCRIHSHTPSGIEVGTGTIISIDKNTYYIITCHHVIKDASSIDLENEIDSKFYKLSVPASQFISDASNDIAVLVLNIDGDDEEASMLPPACIFGVSYELVSEINMCGFPAVKNTKKLTRVPIDKGRLEENFIYRTENKLDTMSSEGNDNCRGFSGGPIYTYKDNFIFLYGIAQEFSNELDYFTIIPLETINSFLSSHQLRAIPLFSSKIFLCNSLHNSSQVGIAKIDCLIGNDIKLPRNEIMDKILIEKKKINILYGEPGIGKSVLLKSLLTKLNFKNFYFRGEDFSETFNESTSCLMELSLLEDEICIIIDSAEKIFDNNFDDSFISAIKLLTTKDNVSFFIGIRSYSIEKLKEVLLLASRVDFMHIAQHEVSIISEIDFNTVVTKYPEIKNLKTNTIQLLKNPFYLAKVIFGKLISKLDNIDNEYQLKNLLWNELTKPNSAVKKILLDFVKEKLNSKSEYIPFTMDTTLEEQLIRNGILHENNSCYKFSHDKYTDIASTKFFDTEAMTKSIVELVQSIDSPLLLSRAFNLWIHDRLSDNALVTIAGEIDELQNAHDVLYIWKWSILEALYESKYFIEYLVMNQESISNDSSFMQKVYNIASSCNLISFDVTLPENTPPYAYFSNFVYPSNKIFDILFFFHSNKELINTNNFEYITKLLNTKTKYITCFPEFVATSNLSFIVELIIHLLKLLVEHQMTHDYSRFNQLVQIFKHYAYLNPETSASFLNEISSSIDDNFSNRFAEFFLTKAQRVNLLEDFGSANLELIEDEVFYLFSAFTFLQDEDKYYGSRFDDDHLYGISNPFTSGASYPKRTIIYEMFNVNFEKTFTFVINYVNSKIEILNENRCDGNNSSTLIEKFIFGSKSHTIYCVDSHFYAFLPFSSVPVLLQCIAQALMQQLLLKKVKTDITQYLKRLLEESNNLILISVAYNIIVSDIKQFYPLFINLSANYFLRMMSITAKVKWNEGSFNASYDYEAHQSLQEYKSILNFKNGIDDAFSSAFMQAQTIHDEQKSIQKVLDEMHTSDDLELQNFAYQHDLRNFVPIGKDGNKVIYSAKELETPKLKEYTETTKKLLAERDKKNNAMFFLRYGGTQPKHEDIVAYYEECKENLPESAPFTKESLVYFYNLYCLQNPALFSKKEHRKSLQNIINTISINKIEIHDSQTTIRTFETFLFLDESIVKRYSKEIITFIYRIIINSSQFALAIDEKSLIAKISAKHKIIGKDLFNLLLGYCYFDEELLKLHLQVDHKAKHTLTIPITAKIHPTEQEKQATSIYHSKKNNFSEELLKRFWKKKGKIEYTNEINFENLYLLDHLVDISDVAGYSETEKHIFHILQKIYESKEDNRWYKQNSFLISFTVSHFICKALQEGRNTDKIQKYILDKHEVFHDIIIHALDTLAGNVQDGILENSIALIFYEKVYLILKKCSYKASLVYDSARSNEKYFNTGRLLSALFLRRTTWVDTMRKRDNNLRIKFVENNKDELMSWASEFLDSSAGIDNYANIFLYYKKELEMKYFIQHIKSLRPALIRPNAFSEEYCVKYYELLCNNIYNEYNTLNQEEKNEFYELLTIIGCNAPSAFALYLKRKIEY